LYATPGARALTCQDAISRIGASLPLAFEQLAVALYVEEALTKSAPGCRLARRVGGGRERVVGGEDLLWVKRVFAGNIAQEERRRSRGWIAPGMRLPHPKLTTTLPDWQTIVI